jgi:hypothetical protein
MAQALFPLVLPLLIHIESQFAAAHIVIEPILETLLTISGIDV